MVKLIIISIGFYLIIGLGALVCHLGFYTENDQQMAIDGGVIVEAEFVKVSTIGTGTGDMLCLNYLYVSDLGVKYEDRIVIGSVSLIEAESRIGEKVNIYIDGKGNSIPVGETTNANLCLVIAIIMDICLLAYTIFVICAFRKIYKDKKEYKEQELAKQN